MKIKSDFATNSSSASFILYIDSNISNLEDFKESWEKYITFFIEDNMWNIDSAIRKFREYEDDSKKKFEVIKEKIENKTLTEAEQKFYDLFYEGKEPKISTDEEIIRNHIIGHMEVDKVVGNTYKISHFTPMFNFILDDVPKWMQYLIISKNMDPNIFSDLGLLSCRLSIEED